MRYVVIGAGAVGGAVGTALLAAGCSVTLVARGRHLQALRLEGMTVARPSGTTRHTVTAAGSPDEVGLTSDDVLLLAVKSQDTPAAVAEWSRAEVPRVDGRVGVGALLPLVCLQNGLENERVAQRHFDRVLAACVWIPGQLVEPGVVVLPGADHIGAVDVGLFPSGVDGVSEQLAADLSRGGIVGRATIDTMRLKYYKLLANIRNVVTALFPTGTEATAIGLAAQQEARAAVMAAGVDLDDLETEAVRVAPLTRLGTVEGYGFAGNSTVQSLASGAGSVETDYLNGEVVLLGHLHGVPTPVNRALQRLAARAARAGAAPGSFTPDHLDEELRR